jgi:signal transduction histidine kinase
LHAFAAALAAAVTPEQVVSELATHAVEGMGAASGNVGLVRREHLEIVAAIGTSGEAPRSISLAAPEPLAHAARQGVPVLLDGPHGTIIATPILHEGAPRSLGAFSLCFAGQRALQDEDRVFLSAAGRICAQALDRARLYESAARARAEAEAGSRAKDEFLSMLSHELRSPLTSVLGWVHILRKRLRGDADAARGLEIIERNSRAQLRLVEDILDVSRIVAGKIETKRERVHLADLLRISVDRARPSADVAGVLLAHDLDTAVGPVLGDPDRIAQIVDNLLANAIKFTPKGGHVMVLLGALDCWARIQVLDTGVGIAPDFLPHVFERFRQADSSTTRRYGGVGLGLSIVELLVQLLGGSVTAESAGKDQGATFTVLLPLATPSSGPVVARAKTR